MAHTVGDAIRKFRERTPEDYRRDIALHNHLKATDHLGVCFGVDIFDPTRQMDPDEQMSYVERYLEKHKHNHSPHTEADKFLIGRTAAGRDDNGPILEYLIRELRNSTRNDFKRQIHELLELDKRFNVTILIRHTATIYPYTIREIYKKGWTEAITALKGNKILSRDPDVLFVLEQYN
jgi:hypothetical protein